MLNESSRDYRSSGENRSRLLHKNNNVNLALSNKGCAMLAANNCLFISGGSLLT
jgi:hypothetical protein